MKGVKKMKSLTFQTVQRAKSGILALIVMVAVISPVAFADGGTLALNSKNSSAQLFQGSKAIPDSVNTGVARVSGKIKLDTKHMGNSVLDFSIFPADENWEHALSPEGNLPPGYAPDAADHTLLTLLTFKSTRILTTGNGKLEVIGDLTLTRVQRSVTADANEAYAGPVYGDPVIHTETREVTFQLKKDAQELSGSARIIHEDFPELGSAIQDTNWPNVVQNERCEMPSTIGEDYHGATCSGTVIAATQNDNCQMPTSGGGEGYTGLVCTPPAGSETTIALDLKLLPTVSEPLAKMGSGNTITR